MTSLEAFPFDEKIDNKTGSATPSHSSISTISSSLSETSSSMHYGQRIEKVRYGLLIRFTLAFVKIEFDYVKR